MMFQVGHYLDVPLNRENDPLENRRSITDLDFKRHRDNGIWFTQTYGHHILFFRDQVVRVKGNICCAQYHLKVSTVVSISQGHIFDVSKL